MVIFTHDRHSNDFSTQIMQEPNDHQWKSFLKNALIKQQYKMWKKYS